MRSYNYFTELTHRPFLSKEMCMKNYCRGNMKYHYGTIVNMPITLRKHDNKDIGSYTN